MELLITLAIAGIITAVAIPSMISIVQNNRLVSIANDFVGDVNLARSLAVGRGSTATLCVSSNQTSCTGSSWAQGWLVWIDEDADGTLDADEIARVHAAISNVTFSSSDNDFVYLSTGFGEVGFTGATLTLTHNNCTSSANRILTLSAAGAPRVAKVACP
jgi:type IV fimbrial biogenesis protein FimT